MEFSVSVDREIAVKTLEEFPELLEYFVSSENKTIEKDSSFIEMIKSKQLSKILEMNNQIGEAISFALPQMLKKAQDKSNAKKIIEYAIENGVDQEMYAGLWEFLLEGFTQGELGSPKIKFSMK